MYTLSPNCAQDKHYTFIALASVGNVYLSEDNEKAVLPSDAQHWFLQQIKNILHENKLDNRS